MPVGVANSVSVSAAVWHMQFAAEMVRFGGPIKVILPFFNTDSRETDPGLVPRVQHRIVTIVIVVPRHGYVKRVVHRYCRIKEDFI